MCPEKRKKRRPDVSFLDIEDEFATDIDSESEASEKDEESSDNDADDFDTETEAVTEKRAVKGISTNGRIIVILIYTCLAAKSLFQYQITFIFFMIIQSLKFGHILKTIQNMDS